MHSNSGFIRRQPRRDAGSHDARVLFGVRLLREDGAALAGLPLHERRERLERFAAAFPDAGTLRLSPVTTDRAVVDGWFERVGGALDGVIAKRRDRRIRAARPTRR